MSDIQEYSKHIYALDNYDYFSGDVTTKEFLDAMKYFYFSDNKMSGGLRDLSQIRGPDNSYESLTLQDASEILASARADITSEDLIRARNLIEQEEKEISKLEDSAKKFESKTISVSKKETDIDMKKFTDAIKLITSGKYYTDIDDSVFEDDPVVKIVEEAIYKGLKSGKIVDEEKFNDLLLLQTEIRQTKNELNILTYKKYILLQEQNRTKNKPSAERLLEIKSEIIKINKRIKEIKKYMESQRYEDKLNELLEKETRVQKSKDVFRKYVGNYNEIICKRIYNFRSTSKYSVGYPYDLENQDDKVLVECKARTHKGVVSLANGKLEYINCILKKLLVVFAGSGRNIIRLYIKYDDLNEYAKNKIKEFIKIYNTGNPFITQKLQLKNCISEELFNKIKIINPSITKDSEFVIPFEKSGSNANHWILREDEKDEAYLLTTYFDTSGRKLKYTQSFVDLKKWIDENFYTDYDEVNKFNLGKLKHDATLFELSGKVKNIEKLKDVSESVTDELILFPYDYRFINPDSDIIKKVIKLKDKDGTLIKESGIKLRSETRLSKADLTLESFIKTVLENEEEKERTTKKKIGKKEKKRIVLSDSELKKKIIDILSPIIYDTDNVIKLLDKVLKKTILPELSYEMKMKIKSYNLQEKYDSYLAKEGALKLTKADSNEFIDRFYNLYNKYKNKKFSDAIKDLENEFSEEVLKDLIEKKIDDEYDKLEKEIENAELNELKKLVNDLDDMLTELGYYDDDYDYEVLEQPVKERIDDILNFITKNFNVENINKITAKIRENVLSENPEIIDEIKKLLTELKGSGKPSNQFITNLLTIDGHEPLVIGTAGTGIKNYGDIDINLVLPLKYKNNILDIIHQIEIALYLIEIKIQNKDKKIKYKSFKDINPDDINKNTDFVKIDFKDITESSIDSYEVIIFLKPPKKRFIKESVKELLMAKNYWKTLKRLFSIARQYEDTEKIKLFTNFIESDVGSVGRKLSLLEALDELGNAFDEKTTTDKLKNKFVKEMNKLIMKDRKRYNEKDIKEDPISWVNEKSREFLRSHNLI